MACYLTASSHHLNNASVKSWENIYKSGEQAISFILVVIPDVYRSYIPNETTYTKYCPTQWISRLLGSFEIH